MPQLLVDAELADARNAIAQAAGLQAVEGHVAFGLGVGALLQHGQDAQVFVQPGRAHRARGQPGHADEFHDVLRLGLRQDALEHFGRVAFFGHRKGGAQLHTGRTQRLQPHDVGMAVDAAGGNQRDVSFVARLLEKLAHLRNHHFEVKTAILQVGHLGRAQVPAGQARVLDHDGVGQTAFLFPFAHQQLHATGVRQDGDECHLGVLAGQLGQIQRQASAHHQRVGAALQRLLHIGLVGAQRLHHVHRDRALALRSRARAADFAVERDQVGGVDQIARIGFLVQVLCLRHQVCMAPAQIDGGDGAHATQPGHGRSQSGSGNAHTHAALHDGQQGLAP